MIIKKITQKDIPQLTETFTIHDFVDEATLKAAAKVKVVSYKPYFNYYNDTPERRMTTVPAWVDGRFESGKNARSYSYWDDWDCKVSGFPKLYGNKPDQTVCSCKLCKNSQSARICEHGAALLMQTFRDLGSIRVVENNYNYSCRFSREQYQRYLADILKYRRESPRDLLPAKDFFRNRKGLGDQQGLVFFDMAGYLENCVTNKAAMDIAREIMADTQKPVTADVHYFREKRTNDYYLEATFNYKVYPGSFQTKCEMRGSSIAWELTCFDADAQYNPKAGCIPADYKDEELGGRTFLDEYQLLAVLELWEDIENRGQISDSTDDNATAFFKSIEKFRENELEDDAVSDAEPEIKNHLTLTPKIITDVDGTALSFKIGREGEKKSYVIKNIMSLVRAWRGNLLFELSKNTMLNFAEEEFNEESMRLFRFILKRHDAISDVYRAVSRASKYDYLEPKVSAKMPLAGHELDNFYEEAQGISAEYDDTDNGIKDTLVVGADAELRFQLNLNTTRDARGNITGISLTGVIPTIKSGTVAKYILAPKTLKKISGRERELLSPFSSIADNSGRFYLFVGRPNLSEFYYRILPVLMDNPFVDVQDHTEGLLDQYLNPEPVFEFFLDYDGSAITLRLQVSYEGKPYIITADKDRSGAYRDIRQEDRVVKEVRRFFLAPDKDEYWHRTVDDDILFGFLSRSLERLEHFGTVRGTQAFNSLKVKKPPVIKIGVSVDSDMMDITVTSAELDKKELLAVMNSYRLKKKWFRLKSGEFIDLTDNDMLQEITEFLEKIDLVPAEVIQKKAKLPLFRALYLDRLMQEHESLAMSRDNTYRRLIRSFNSIRDSDFEPADVLKDVLREYQKHGFKWLETVKQAGFGGILADDMGLGKTIQMISVIKASLDAGAKKPSLVVCPASLVYNWAEEFRRFTPDIRACPVAGTLAVRKAYLGDLSDKDVLITSYDLLTRDIALYQNLEFELLIIDEAQYIKNPKAGHTKAVKSVKGRARFALTGTPIENRLSELWSIFDYVMPGFLYSYAEFNKKFETPITKGKDEAAIAMLKNMTSPFILRRKKADVLKNLPAKIDEVRYTRITGEQQKLYDAQVVRMKKMIQLSGDSGEDKIKILAELTRIRQICCDPSLVYENYAKESAKREACMELVETAIDSGHRMLVFSQFTSMLELLEQDLTSRGISYFKITGSTPKEKRITMVHEFNEGDVPVFLISLKAGGTGLNLIGADTVIHYDPWWNLAVQNQATDRAHRIGQTRNVTVYRLILKDTIEEKILKLQETKKDLAESILEGNSQSLMSLSSEELLELLS